jgi:large subunit ribosomal protein L30
MAKVKVTQIKSTIDRAEKQKRTMKALGLHHMHASRVHDESEAVKGMIRVVSHLVKVEPAE